MTDTSLPADVPALQGEFVDYRIHFTGKGIEYFRIWIVNTLLLIVTLGLYLPWARVRKLRYFYSNTVVDDHAFDFHGEPKKMLRGMLLAGVFLGLYSKALDVSVVAWAVATGALIVVWPLLFRTSMQFRLAHTSWRGLRFGFVGDKKGAYWSVGLGLAALVVPFGWLQWRVAALVQKPGANVTVMLSDYAIVVFLLALVLPYLFWRVKHYQHAHFVYGQEQTQLRTTAKSMYGVVIKTALLALGMGVVSALLLGAAGFLGLAGGLNKGIGSLVVFAVLQLIVFVVFFNAVAASYWKVAIQNLVWSRTGNEQFRLISRLRFGAFAWLQIKNYTLIVLTLGFYWPFAVIRSRKMQLRSMALRTRGLSLRDLHASAQNRGGQAVGDAAVDLFGMDVGL